MRKGIFILLFPLLLLAANDFERGVGYFLYGEKSLAKKSWSIFFGKRKDHIAQGYLSLADGDYLKASYHFKSYRKESRDAYYGKYEWMRYLGLSLAVYDIAYFQRDWFVARAKRFYPEAQIITFVQGVYDLEMGRLNRAEKRLISSVNKLKDPIFEVFLARLYIEKGELAKAEEIFEKNGKDARIGMELANAYAERGEYSKGHEILMSLPKTRKVIEKIADFAFYIGNEYAVKDIEPLIPEDDPLAREIQAFHYINVRKYKKARKILLKISLYRPSDPHIWKWLALGEKKENQRLKYLYLSFFNGGDVKNLFGVTRKKLKKVDSAKWLGSKTLVIKGRPDLSDEFGLYVIDVATWEKIRIPLLLEIEDYYPQKDGETLLISALDRIRGRRVFYIWRKGYLKPKKTVVMSLTDEKFIGEIQGDTLLIYSEDYNYLPFNSPFKKLANSKTFLFLYSKSFPHRFIVYSISKGRASKVSDFFRLPFIPESIKKYLELRDLYYKDSGFKLVIDSHSSFGGEDLQIKFYGDDAAVIRKKEGKKYLVGYIYQGRWVPYRLMEDEEEFEFVLWEPSLNLFICRDKEDNGYMFRPGEGKFRDLEDEFGGAVYWNNYLYFIAGNDDGKKRLYRINPITRKKEKLTDYLWVDIFKTEGRLLLKDPATAVYAFKGDAIIPVYVESDYSVVPSEGMKKVFIFSTLKRWAFLVQLNW